MATKLLRTSKVWEVKKWEHNLIRVLNPHIAVFTMCVLLRFIKNKKKEIESESKVFTHALLWGAEFRSLTR